ncbi:hypothetical protein [Shewanella sp.]|uniref:hypothetical protein n=1 Tax=Shewanella sp. TaxID=50422 RepID=UPI004048A4F0
MNTAKNDATQHWLNSKDTMKALKVSACHLMHMRLSGDITFKKKGNAYWYLVSSNNNQ